MTNGWLGQVRLAQGSYREPLQTPESRPRPRVRAVLSGSKLGADAGPVILTDATFSQALSAPQAVVDFWSPTCPNCMRYKPIFEDVASQVGGNILMVSAQVEDAPKSAGKYAINAIPATIFLVNGKEVNRIEGDMSKQDLLDEIAKAFGGGAPQQTNQAMPSRLPSPMVTAPSVPIPTSSLIVGGISLAAIAGAVYLFATSS